MPLSLMNVGEQRRIHTVQASPEVSRRLTSLGFTAGEPVTVVGKLGRSLVVCIRNCRIALDGGSACCIRVCE